MNKSTLDLLKDFAWPTYFVGFLMFATPALDFLTNVWPFRVGDVQWRYGAAGIFAGFLLTPVFGILFALGAAVVLKHRMVIRVLSVLNLVAAVLLLVLIVFFALDVVQVRSTIPDDAVAEARSMFRIGAVKAAIKFGTVALALAWLGISGIRASRRRESGSRSRKSGGKDVPLVRSAEAQ